MTRLLARSTKCQAPGPQCSTQQAPSSIPCPPYMAGLLPPALHLSFSPPSCITRAPGQ